MTVAWLAPPRIGAPKYRCVQIKMNEPKDSAAALAVAAGGDQPDYNQIHNVTVAHRRWEGHKAAVFGENATFDIVIQRQIDDVIDPTPYAMVVTLKMAGVAEIYTQIRNRLAIKPPIAGPVRWRPGWGAYRTNRR